MLTFGVSQVRFALSSSPVFSRMDTTTDSETFYNSVLSLLEDEEEKDEIHKLLMWWNQCVIFTFYLDTAASQPPFCCRQVFPSRLSARQPIRKNSALARIKQRRLEINGVDLAREA